MELLHEVCGDVIIGHIDACVEMYVTIGIWSP